MLNLFLSYVKYSEYYVFIVDLDLRLDPFFILRLGFNVRLNSIGLFPNFRLGFDSILLFEFEFRFLFEATLLISKLDLY